VLLINRLYTIREFMNRIAFLAVFLILPLGLRAQDPNLAPDDLKFTQGVADANHLIAQVRLQVGENDFVRFRYDRYPELKQIKDENGFAYTQLKGKEWMKSDDWGKTGVPVKPGKAGDLDVFASMAESPLGQAVTHDNSQGKTVWKLVAKKKKVDFELYTYERSREKPKTNGVYPRYTFIKYKNDKDGQLLLEHFSAQMRSEGKLIPVEIEFGFMILMPPGSVIIEGVPSKKEIKCQ